MRVADERPGVGDRFGRERAATREEEHGAGEGASLLGDLVDPGGLSVDGWVLG